MALFNVLVEDSSPLISYAPSGAWADSPANDTLVASYSGRSLHTTATQGATATINFNGTGLIIFGGHRPGYGTFTITVDGRTVNTGDANSPQATTRQVLGSVSGLDNGPHTAVLTNTGGSAIDIDVIEVDSQIGPPESKLIATVYDDADPNVKYSSGWLINNGTSFAKGTLHYSQIPGASASLTFSGDAVAVYGTMSPDHADVQITLDDRSRTFTGGAGGVVSGLRTQVLLYYADNLGPAQHTLTMANSNQPNTGPFIDLDSITVFSTTPSSSSTPPEGSTSNDAGSKAGSRQSRSVSKSTIIGATIGGVFGLLILIGLVFIYLRRRRSTISKLDIRPPMTPDLPMQGAGMMESGFLRPSTVIKDLPPLAPSPPVINPPTPRYSIARHSIAPSYYSDPSYASDAGAPSRTSSLRSSAMLVPKLPTDLPQAPAAYRNASRGSGSALSVDATEQQRKSETTEPTTSTSGV